MELIPFAYESQASAKGMTWRFLAASDPAVDVFLIRDLDSRLSLRERFGMVFFFLFVFKVNENLEK